MVFWLGFGDLFISLIGPLITVFPIVWETRVLSQLKLYQRLKKCYLMPPCLIFSIINYWSRVNGATQVSKTLLSILADLNSAVVWIVSIFPLIYSCSSTLWCSSYWKESLRVALYYSQPTICLLKSQRILSLSYSRTNSGLCIYYLSVWSSSCLLHNSQWVTIPTHSCLLLYFFYAKLLHSFIMWVTLIISALHSVDLNYWWCCS